MNVPPLQEGDVVLGLVVRVLGLTLLVLGSLISLLNFYLSFLRYPLFLFRGGMQDAYRWNSGFPIFGSVALWVSEALLWESTCWKWMAVIISVFDTGGIHWLLVTLTWRWMPYSFRKGFNRK